MIHNEPIKKIPVILDTDISGDIDDAWALAFLLGSPEFDVKLIVTATGDTIYRAKTAARLLESGGRTDIPLGIGLQIPMEEAEQHSISKLAYSKPLEAWVRDYALGKYPGTLHKDGVGAMVDTIMKSEEQITLISIGPLTNIGAALERNPEIAAKARFVGMQGSIYKTGKETNGFIAEYNVWADIKSSQKVFSAPWDMTITPLDTCGEVVLKGEKYLKVYNSKIPLVKALMENYKIWCTNSEDPNFDKSKYLYESTQLFDTVAIYLAMAHELLHIEELGIRVTEEGYTLPDENSKKVNCALAWKSIEVFEDLLVERLIG